MARPVTSPAAAARAGTAWAWRARLLYAGLAGFAVLLVAMMLSWPLGYDQGVFLSVGDVVARGGAPYRDAWDVKGPLVQYWSAAIRLLFGRHAWGIRVVDVGITLVTAWLLWRRLRLITSRGAALVAATMWPVLVASFSYHDAAQFDLWVGSAMLGVALLATRPAEYRARDLALAGALVGLASLTKPIFPAFLAVPGVAVLMRRRLEWRGALRDLGALVAGFLAPIAAVTAALWMQGALREAWEVHILYNLRVYAPNAYGGPARAASPAAMRVAGLVAYLTQPRVAALLLPAGAGAAVLWRRDRRLAAAAFAWLTVGVALVLLQNKFWRYHWEIVYPAVFLLAAVGVHAAARAVRAPGPRGRPAAAAAVLALAGVAFALWAGGAAIDLRRWLLAASGRRSAAWYDHTLLQYGEIDPADAAGAAAYVRARTPPGAPIAQWTLQGGLAFLAGRPHVARFFNKRELTNTSTHPVTRAYRREYLGRVDALRPAYIAVDRLGDVGTRMAAQGRDVTPADVLAREFPELAALVAARYERAARFGDIDVYRLRAPGPPARPVAAGAAGAPGAAP